MAKHPTVVTFATLALEHSSSVPLYRQLYDTLREAILTGQFVTGTRLPSTRALAAELHVSRNTVMGAFEQLLAEGYLEGKIGSGTSVTRALPDDLLHARSITTPAPQGTPVGRSLSRRSSSLWATPTAMPRGQGEPRAFRPGIPAFDAFPFEIWARLASRHWQHPSADLLGYGDPAGYGPLRAEIAAYLGTARGVRCAAQQVIVVAGAQQALNLAAQVLLDPGDPACIEDPGYLGARSALLSASAHLIPIPVDSEGLSIAALTAQGAGARVIYVSPSHQYPLGVTMSLARRLALLEWANCSGAWVLEDDYDSEYRYTSRPLAALQGLDTEGRVIYLGTFSKVLFPSLRLGYLVVPPDLVDIFVAARANAGRYSPLLEQAALTDFMAEGHFARHIRRMRALYAKRQAALLEAAAYQLTGLLEVRPAEAGMQLMGWLPEGTDDRVASHQALTQGVEAPPLSAYSLQPTGRRGLLLGYAGVNEEEIREGVGHLKVALQALKNSSKRLYYS